MFAAKKKKTDDEEKFPTVNGALDILLSHITRVLSASSARIRLQL